ncbi:hypothetical protein ElyMa_005621100 [Elysia marginata]|uniref:Uncharacterized protein n=1 Tax=Elysia marginata TaxID=1093978 RepID=A0AAV4F7S5_9GAST|nr:hypothetical protein ElyMa_005621100 [Elysia marginata]
MSALAAGDAPPTCGIWASRQPGSGERFEGLCRHHQDLPGRSRENNLAVTSCLPKIKLKFKLNRRLIVLKSNSDGPAIRHANLTIVRPNGWKLDAKRYGLGRRVCLKRWKAGLP